MSSIRRWVLDHAELEAAVHGGLLQFQLDGLSFQNGFAIVGVLVRKPGLKLSVFPIQQFEDFTHDVGRVCVEELCVPVEVESDFFLQANLEHCGLWLL
jgi:hypothetical protein